LNAKNHEREAFIIAQAGKKNAITVATNMAGRGVDIVMGGDIQRSNYKSEKEYEKAAKQWEKEHEEVLSLGGLYVIGTERHESRRIDNQLRGRSGRQGDAGETRFYVSLEDDVMRIFGGDQISKLMTFLNFPEDQPLSHPMVSRAIEQAQVKVEGHNFDIRKHLVEYDDVLNKQREIVYTLRRKMLMLPEENPEGFKTAFFELVGEQVRQLSASYFSLRQNDEVETGTFAEDISLLLNIPAKEVMKALTDSEEKEFEEFIVKKTEALFKKREKEIGQDIWYQVIRSLFLPTFDQFWTVHLTAIDDLREGVRLRAHAQMDPLVEYKNEAFIMFEKLISDIQFESIRRVMKVEIKQETAQQEVIEAAEKKPQKMEFSSAAALNPFKPEEPKKSKQKKESASPVQTEKNKKIGRNDPCWCGSGKKYKKCHYPN
jgi:preprotein translocase subunit SecA